MNHIEKYYPDGNSKDVLLLQLVHSMRVTTRAELGEISNLSPSAVSKIIRRLIQNEFVEEIGTVPSTGGRPAVQLALNPQARFAIGAEFSLHRIKVVVTDLYATVQYTYEVDSPARNADAITESLLGLIQQALAEFRQEQIVGVGIAVPGVADPAKGLMEFFSSLNLRQYPLGEKVQEATGFFPAVYNRHMAAAMGEKWQGDDLKGQSLFYLSIGATNVGGGLILQGKPYQGASMAVAEIAHVTVMPGGPLCFCGNRGCLQIIASGSSLVSRVREEIKHNHASSLVDQVDGNLELIDTPMVLRAVDAGDELATNVLLEVTDCIGIALANVVNLLSPEMIVLSGSLIDAHPDLLAETIKSAVKRHSLAWPMRNTEIVVDQLGNRGRSIGAAALAIHSWLKKQSPLHPWDMTEVPQRKLSDADL